MVSVAIQMRFCSVEKTNGGFRNITEKHMIVIFFEYANGLMQTDPHSGESFRCE